MECLLIFLISLSMYDMPLASIKWLTDDEEEGTNEEAHSSPPLPVLPVESEPSAPHDAAYEEGKRYR